MNELVLRSRKTVLRRMCPDDAQTLYDYRSLPEVSRYQDWAPESVDEVSEMARVQADLEPATSGTWLQFIICRGEDGTMVGDCGVNFPREQRRDGGLSRRAPTGQKAKRVVTRTTRPGS